MGRATSEGIGARSRADTAAKRIHGYLREMGVDVCQAHPLKVRRCAGNQKKADTLDFFELADRRRMKRPPEAFVPSSEARDRRQAFAAPRRD